MTHPDASRYIVLIPALNEPDTVGDLVDRVAKLAGCFTPLVVDDGSTVPLSPQAVGTCLFVRLPTNMGLGVSTNIAIDHASRFGYRGVVRMDADGQHDVADISRLVEPLTSGEFDLVVGKRINHRQSGFRGLMASALKAYVSILSRLVTRGHAPSDMNSGFFAIGVAAMQALNKYDYERYPEPQLFLAACRENLRIKEVEITQMERRFGKTSLGFVSAFRFLLRFNLLIVNEVLAR